MYKVIEHFNELIAKEKHIYAIERNEKNSYIAIIYNDNVDSHPYDIQIDAYAYLKVDRVFYMNALYKEDDNNIFIEDIRNPNKSINKRYGEIGMKYLIEIEKMELIVFMEK